ncbi:GM19563 [Drosophila sechellia]|uniref:GM19563 n=1 Tax=Drosophila sechellia TaxID=7238 RepID=B4ILS6_DROSE|nr:GM19563 [Drosophila sechellia]
MKLSVSAYRAHASAHKKILSSGYHSQLNYGSTGAAAASSSSSGATATGLYTVSVHGVHDAHDVHDVPESLSPWPPHPANAALVHFRTEQSDFDSDFGFPEGQSLSQLVFQLRIPSYTARNAPVCSIALFKLNS